MNRCPKLCPRPQLFKRWIALSSGEITFQWISITEINYAIHWIVIYPEDSAIQHLNNCGQMNQYPVDKYLGNQ